MKKIDGVGEIINFIPYTTEEFVTTMTMAKGEYFSRTGIQIEKVDLYGWNNNYMVFDVYGVNNTCARVIIKRRR